MDRRDAALLRVHERNIDKYQRLLKTKLSEAEVHTSKNVSPKNALV